MAKNSNKIFESLLLKAISIYLDNALKHTASANSKTIDGFFYSLDEIIKIDPETSKNAKKWCFKLILNVFKQFWKFDS